MSGPCEGFDIEFENSSCLQEFVLPADEGQCSGALGSANAVYVSACSLCSIGAQFQDTNSEQGVVSGVVEFGPVQWLPEQLLSPVDDSPPASADERELIEYGEGHIARYSVFLLGSGGQTIQPEVATLNVKPLPDAWDGCCLSALYRAEVTDVEVPTGTPARFLVVPVTQRNERLPGQLVEGPDCCAPESESSAPTAGRLTAVAAAAVAGSALLAAVA